MIHRTIPELLPASMSNPGRRDGTGLLLGAIVLAGLPLLSRATLWGGAAEATWPELVALPVWIAALLAGRTAWQRAGLGVWPALGLYAAAIVAGVVVALLGNHHLGSPVMMAKLATAVGGWFGAWSTSDPLYPLKSSTTYLAGPLFFVAVRSIWREGRRPRRFDALIVWGGAAAAALAVMQASLGRGLVFEGSAAGPLVARAPGPFPDPNSFAAYLALVAAFGAVTWTARVCECPRSARKLQIAAAGSWAILILAGLWVSGSRAALLALVALLLVFLVAKPNILPARSSSRMRLVLVAVAIGTVLVGLLAVASLGSFGSSPNETRMQRYLSALDLSQPSMRLLRGRPALWSAGVTMVMDEPVVGVGSGRFGVELPGRIPDELWGVVRAENAHNYYLQLAAEIGIVGFLCFFVVLAAAFGALWTNRREVGAIAALFGAGAWCLTSLAGHPQLIPSLQLFFWGFLGMASSGYPLPRISPRFTVLSILLVLLVARVGQAALLDERGPALYATGLHDREFSEPGNEVRRWTAEHAELDLRREGHVVEVRFFVAHDALPVAVRSGTGPWSEERHFFDGGWKTLTYYVPGTASNRLLISLDTAPAYVVEGDPRRLGVVMAPLRWRWDRPREPLGTYAVEQDEEGRRFRWTAGVACLPLAGDGEVEVALRAGNPDLDVNPLNVTLSREGAPPQTVSLGDRGWQSVRLPASDTAEDILCVQSARTWNPRIESGSADSRDLGVAIALGDAEPGR